LTTRDLDESRTWLLRRSPEIRGLFISIFTMGFTAGSLRFLIPFQILNLGGSEALMSLASSLFGVGQVLGLVVVSRLFQRRRSSFLASGLLLSVFTVAMAATPDESVLVISRLSEGAALGLLTILIVKISSQFRDHRGEAVGTLLSALFMGSAIGQGTAGLLVEYASVALSYQQADAIRLLALVLSLPLFAVVAAIALRAGRDPMSPNEERDEHRHVHLSQLMRAILSRRMILLTTVYFLYDFSHGFYTPVLSVLINNNGVPIDQIGIGYLSGDIVWSLVQLYAGRVVDRIGHLFPLVLSLTAKGLVVFFYPGVTTLLSLLPLLALAGVAEGFLEPARNDAAMAYSPADGLTHDHPHFYIAHAPGVPFSLSRHEHEHTHVTGSDQVVSVLQTIGIIGFVLGSGGGAWLLVYGTALSTLVVVGGYVLIVAGVAALGLREQKRQ